MPVSESHERNVQGPPSRSATDNLIADATQPEVRETQTESNALRKPLRKKGTPKMTGKEPARRKKARPALSVDNANTPKAKQNANIVNDTLNSDDRKPTPIRVIEINVDDPKVTFVEGDEDGSGGKMALKSIVGSLGSEPYGTSIQRLRKWLRVHASHRLRTTAKYAIGYCEFKRGRLDTARRIFARLPKGNPWIRTIQDFDNPPKPY